MLCAKFSRNCPCRSGEEDENVKSLREQQRMTNFNQKRSLEASAQVSQKHQKREEKFLIN